MIPGFGFAAQRSDIPDPALPQALTAEESNLNFGLIQPTSMLGCVMHCESLPKPSARRLTEAVHQCLTGVSVQVVQDQVDSVGSGIVVGNLQNKVGELICRTGRSHFGEMNTCLRLDSAKDVRCAAALVFIIPSRYLTGPHRNRGPRIFM